MSDQNKMSSLLYIRAIVMHGQDDGGTISRLYSGCYIYIHKVDNEKDLLIFVQWMILLFNLLGSVPK